MATVAPNDPQKRKKYHINGVLKTIAIVSSLLGLDRVYFISETYKYRILSKIYSGCLVISTGVFYLKLFIQEDSIINFFKEYVTALEYCALVIFKLMRSKRDSKDFFKIMQQVDASFPLKIENDVTRNIIRYSTVLCLVQSIIFAVLPIIVCLCSTKVVQLESFILCILSAVHDMEVMFIVNLMLMVETRILAVNAYLKKLFENSFNQSPGYITQLEELKSTEPDTRDIYQIYVKVFSLYKKLKTYMNFPVTVIIVSTFLIAHPTCIFISKYVNSNIDDEEITFTRLYLAVSMLKSMAGLTILGVLGSRTGAAGATLPHTLADILTDVTIEKSERRRLKGFLRSCAERPFRYTLCRVIPLDVTLLANFVGLTISYVVIGSQFTKLSSKAALPKK